MINKKPAMLMFVYNDLNQDARVQRSIDVLKDDFQLTVLSIDNICQIQDTKNIVLISKYASGIKKYLDIIVKAIKFAKKFPFDYLYLHDYYSTLLGVFVNKNGRKIIYDAHELMIDVANQRLSKRDKFFHFFEKKVVKKADCIIAAQKKRAQIMQKYFKLKKMPYVVPNYSELPMKEKYQFPLSLSNFLDEDDRKVFVYAGALTADRKINAIIDETAKVCDKYKLLIVGDGGEKKNLLNLSKRYPNLKCYFTGNIPYKFLGQILQKCDVGFMSYPTTNLNNLYCAPNKIYEYASVNLPMICNDNPTLYEIVSRNGIGVSITSKKEKCCCQTMSEALNEICYNYLFYKENIIKFREENSWDDISKKYRKWILGINKGEN